MKKLIGIVAALAVFFALQACGEGDGGVWWALRGGGVADPPPPGIR